MASQNARLSKFEADFKQQQSEMTNKIDIVLNAITDRIARALPSDTVKNSKLNVNTTTSFCLLVLTQLKTRNAQPISMVRSTPSQSIPSNKATPMITSQQRVRKERSIARKIPIPTLKSLGLALQSPNTGFVCTKGDAGDMMFIEIVKKNDNSRKEEPESGRLEVEYFDTFLTWSELAYHKYLMCGPIPTIFLRNPIIMKGCPSNLKISCSIRHVHVEKAYIDLNSPLNVITRMMFNYIMRRKLDPRENSDRGARNFMGKIKGMHVP
nr:MAK10-like protein [Tanacetum cinerariifolium]